MRDFLDNPPANPPNETRGLVACPWGREALENGEIHILKFDSTNKAEIQSSFEAHRDSAKGFLVQFEVDRFPELYNIEDFNEAREAFKTLWNDLGLNTEGFSTIVQSPIYKGRIKSRQAEKYQVVIVRKELFDDKIPALYKEPGCDVSSISDKKRAQVESLLSQAPENAYRGNAPFMPFK